MKLSRLVLALVAILGMTAVAGTAEAQTFPIVNVGGRCADVLGFATHNGAAIAIWDCNGKQNQQWAYTAAGEIRGYGNKCLDVFNFQTSNGAVVNMWDCNGYPNQKWTLTPGGQIVGYGGKCLDVTGGNNSTGTKLQMWDCNGTAAQQWKTPYLAPPSLTVVDERNPLDGWLHLSGRATPGSYVRFFADALQGRTVPLALGSSNTDANGYFQVTLDERCWGREQGWTTIRVQDARTGGEATGETNVFQCW